MIGFVYICRREYGNSGRHKIGCTSDLDRRMDEFNRETGADSEMLPQVVFACPLGYENRLERAAHRIAANHRHRSEWFDLTVDAAARIVIQAAVDANIRISLHYDRVGILSNTHIDDSWLIEARRIAALSATERAAIQAAARQAAHAKAEAKRAAREAEVKARADAYWATHVQPAYEKAVAELIATVIEVHSSKGFFGIGKRVAKVTADQVSQYMMGRSRTSWSIYGMRPPADLSQLKQAANNTNYSEIDRAVLNELEERIRWRRYEHADIIIRRLIAQST